jgi:hypothetical protein
MYNLKSSQNISHMDVTILDAARQSRQERVGEIHTSRSARQPLDAEGALAKRVRLRQR